MEELTGSCRGLLLVDSGSLIDDFADFVGGLLEVVGSKMGISVRNIRTFMSQQLRYGQQGYV